MARLHKRDFEALARHIRETPGLTLAQRTSLAVSHAEVLETTNPGFSRERFIEAATRPS